MDFEIQKNIFEQIRDGEASANIVYKDKYVTAFKDKFPDTPVHILIIPNRKIVTLSDIKEDDAVYMSKIMICASNIAKEYNLHESGFRLITNSGKNGGQEVQYLHFHLVGGCKLGKMLSLPKESKKIMKELKNNKVENMDLDN